MFYSFYKTPTNAIKSWYPCSLHWQSFFLLLPLSAHPTQPPAHCRHSWCSDHTWDPLTNPFQDFWGEMKTLWVKQEVQQVKTLSLVGVIRLSGVRVFTCAGIQAGRRSNASDRGGVIKGGKRNLPAALLSQEMKRVSSCSTQEQVC